MVLYGKLLLGIAAVPIAAGAVLAAKSMTAEPSPLETPAGVELMTQLRDARDGAVIRLARKNYGLVTFPAATHPTPVRIDATGAQFAGLVLRGANGFTVEGGTVVGPGGRSYGISIDGSNAVTIARMRITGAHRGIVVNASSNIALLSNTLTGLLSDGMDIALSRKIVVRGNSCSSFAPTMDSYDPAGKLVKGGGDHPDCIQAWSRPSAPPSADFLIEGNHIEGKMQGIFMGNHKRGGVDDGGFDRVIVRNNTVRVSLYNGIAVGDARDSVVTGNIVTTLPGGFNPKRPTSPIRAWLRVTGVRTIVCGNTVADFPLDPSNLPCPPGLRRP